MEQNQFCDDKTNSSKVASKDHQTVQRQLVLMFVKTIEEVADKSGFVVVDYIAVVEYIVVAVQHKRLVGLAWYMLEVVAVERRPQVVEQLHRRVSHS